MCSDQKSPVNEEYDNSVLQEDLQDLDDPTFRLVTGAYEGGFFYQNEEQ